MNEEELKEMYKGLKRNKKIIGSIDTDFFFEFAETALNLLEKKDQQIDLLSETLRYYNGMQQEQCFCIDICGEKECDMKNCKDRIKQYVEYKLEEDK